MKRRLFGAIVAFFGILNLGFHMESNSFRKVSLGIHESEVTAIATESLISTVFLGTSKAVYKSQSTPQSFKRVFFLPSTSRINQLHVNPQNPSDILAATDSGIWESTDGGEHWQIIFNPRNELSQRCNSVLADDRKIYVATLDGLYIRERNVPIWRKFPDLKVNQPAFYLTADPQFIYLASDRNVLRIRKSDGISREIYAMPGKEPEAGDQLWSDEFSREIFKPQILALKYFSTQNALYLVTAKGILFSRDHGITWEEIPAFEIPLNELEALEVLGDGRILLATRQGIFLGQDGSWESLYEGMEARIVNDVALGGDGNLYAATDRGLFYIPVEKAVANRNVNNEETKGDSAAGLEPVSDMVCFENQVSLGSANKLFSHEPAIEGVQAMAIEYADVHPRKIEQWRRRANHKAALPTVSVGLDRSASELYHWDTGGSPDYLVKGRDFLEWDISLSWNLGDLIWNNDLTSIDSRSKLMVELRADILDEVTRLYFERRRLQVGLLQNNAENAGGRLDQEMRVAELTALIDGLTGGEFSKEIKQDVP